MMGDHTVVEVCYNGRCITTTLRNLYRAWQTRTKDPYYLRGQRWNVVTRCVAARRRVVEVRLMSGRRVLVTPGQPVVGPAWLLRPGQVVQTETGEDQVLWVMTLGVTSVIGVDAACFADGILIDGER